MIEPRQPDFTPHPWLLNKHVMTMVAALLPSNQSALKFDFERLLIPVDDQSLIRADAHLNPDNQRCLILVHGLEGSSSSPYILSLTVHALAHGFNVVRINLRNCGNTLHLTPTLYNAGQSGDLVKIVEWLKEKKNQTKQYLIGYSLGGNIVLKMQAEVGHNIQSLVSVCAVSPSIDLAACVNSLSKGLNKIYEYTFLRTLREKIKQKHKLFPERFSLDKLTKVNSIRSFDDLYTAPDAGYMDAAHYYREASSATLLNQIKKTTLIITAQDDPFIPFALFQKIDNPHVQIQAPLYGGHVAFLSNTMDFIGTKKEILWLDNQIISFCEQ